MDGLAPGQHVDQGGDLLLATGLGLHALGAEDQGEAVLARQGLEQGLRLGDGVDGRPQALLELDASKLSIAELSI